MDEWNELHTHKMVSTYNSTIHSPSFNLSTFFLVKRMVCPAQTKGKTAENITNKRTPRVAPILWFASTSKMAARGSVSAVGCVCCGRQEEASSNLKILRAHLEHLCRTCGRVVENSCVCCEPAVLEPCCYQCRREVEELYVKSWSLY